MTTFFTADTHFGHERVISLCKRPFSDASAMRETLIQRWNSVVGPDDEIWHLGDFAHRASVDEVQSVFYRLNGTKHLIVGNHDGPATLAMPWASVSDRREIVVGTTEVTLCHYPLATWPGMTGAAIHLFGHMHGRDPDPHVPGSLDVGVDCWDFRPIDANTAIERIEGWS